jgi:hypothetical protein
MFRSDTPDRVEARIQGTNEQKETVMIGNPIPRTEAAVVPHLYERPSDACCRDLQCITVGIVASRALQNAELFAASFARPVAVKTGDLGNKVYAQRFG